MLLRIITKLDVGSQSHKKTKLNDSFYVDKFQVMEPQQNNSLQS